MKNDKLWAPLVCAPDKNIAIPSNMRVLDVGFGGIKIPGALGIDWKQFSPEDVVHNLNENPWPLPDKTFDLIVSTHCLEHLIDVPQTLSEMARIGKKGAHIVIQVPYFRSVLAFTDPTHKHFFASKSLDDFEHLKILKIWLGSPVKNSFIKKFINKHPYFYDKYLSRLIPCDCITWELEVI